MAIWLAPHLSSQQVANKTKRTIPEGVNFGDPSTVWVYSDNLKPPATPRNAENVFSNSKPLALVELQPLKLIEPPKEAPQPFVYEFQQSPTNLIPSVKQLLGREMNFNQEIQQYKQPLFHNHNPNILTSESIVSPVHHSNVIRNHQHFPGQKNHPLFNVQPTYQIPKKYTYVNGKIIYDPSTFQLQQAPLQAAPNFFHSAQVFPPQHLQKQQLFNYPNRPVPRPNLTPPAVQQIPTDIPSITKFQTPKMQTIDTPSSPPPNNEKSKHSRRKGDKDEEKPVVEDEEPEEEYEEKSSYQEEEYEPYDDDKPLNERYSFDDEDSDHLEEYNDRDESEEDSDNNRGSSKTRYVTTKVKKYPKKKYRPGKKSELHNSGKYEYPERHHPKQNNKKQKLHYKGYKYSKNVEDPEFGHSETVPVVHKQKLFKEKWFVSKSLSDKKNFDD